MAIVVFYSRRSWHGAGSTGWVGRGRGAVSVTGGMDSFWVVSIVKSQSRLWEEVPGCFAGGWLLFDVPSKVSSV